MTRQINKIVIHHSAVDQSDVEKAIKSFDENHKRLHKDKNGFGFHIAYHYVIGEGGEIYQARPLEEVGFHASNLSVNKTSIGICLVGDFDKRQPYEVQYKMLNKLIGDLAKKYKLSIHFHNEYSKKTCPGTMFDKTKVNMLPVDPVPGFVPYFTIVKDIIMSFYKEQFAKQFPDKKPLFDINKALQVCFKPDGTTIPEELMYLLAILVQRLSSK